MSKFFILTLALFLQIHRVYSLELNSRVPDFKLYGIKSNTEISLAEYKNKVVVLEWLNHGCPFIQKHYETKNMQAIQKKYSDKGVIWLSVISSGPGKQGHVTRKKGLEDIKTHGSKATEVLLDEKGMVGKMFEAKATPHMFIINSQGFLVYQGAIDDQPGLDREEMNAAKNYVAQALDEILANKSVSIPSTKAYGCSVKYAQ